RRRAGLLPRSCYCLRASVSRRGLPGALVIPCVQGSSLVDSPPPHPASPPRGEGFPLSPSPRGGEGRGRGLGHNPASRGASGSGPNELSVAWRRWRITLRSSFHGGAPWPRSVIDLLIRAAAPGAPGKRRCSPACSDDSPPEGRRQISWHHPVISTART